MNREELQVRPKSLKKRSLRGETLTLVGDRSGERVWAKGSAARCRPVTHWSRQGCIRQQGGTGLLACSGDMLRRLLLLAPA